MGVDSIFSSLSATKGQQLSPSVSGKEMRAFLGRADIVETLINPGYNFRFPRF